MDCHLTNGVITQYMVTYEDLSENAKKNETLSRHVYQTLLQLEKPSSYMISIKAATAVGFGPAKSFLILMPEKGRFVLSMSHDKEQSLTH